jgi:hypothetical protein
MKKGIRPLDSAHQWFSDRIDPRQWARFGPSIGFSRFGPESMSLFLLIE